MVKEQKSNSKSGKGYLMGKGKRKGKRQGIQEGASNLAPKAIAPKQERKKVDLLVPGKRIECLGKKNFYPRAVFKFMKKHCLRCARSFPTPAQQKEHMEEFHENFVVCRKCFQAFLETTDMNSTHSSRVPAKFKPFEDPAMMF